MSPTLKPMPGLRAAVLLALIAITACASLATRSQMDAFDQISKQYRHALLASDFEAAASMTATQTMAIQVMNGPPPRAAAPARAASP